MVLSLAGVAGSLVGGLIAWTLGANAGRALIDRPDTGSGEVDRAQRWLLATATPPYWYHAWGGRTVRVGWPR